MEHSEKRKEPRFPFQIPLELFRDKQYQPRKVACTTSNVSMNGFKASSMDRLTQGEQIVCAFNIPETTEKVESKGIIKWSSSNGRHYVGVELSEKQTAAHPLLKLSEAYLREKSSQAGQAAAIKTKDLPFSKDEMYEELHPEMYCGMLFKAFSKPLQTGLIGLSTEIELRKFYLNNIRDRIGGDILSEESTEHLDEIGKTLDKSRRSLNNIISLLQQIFTKSAPDRQQGIPEALDLQELLSESVQNFKKKLSAVVPEDAAKIRLEPHSAPLIFAYRHRLEKGLDLLLLYCYHFILFFGAKNVLIRLDKTDNNIILAVSNDGSKIFAPEKIELTSSSLSVSDQEIKPQMKKHLAILSCAMDLFKPVKTAMVLTNQSGNNQLTVTISL